MTGSAETGGGEPVKIAVVGAGVSGLAAADRLRDLAAAANRPTAVTLFEPGEIGGGCRTLTEEHAGEPVVRELGPDSFLSKPPDLVRFCERVGIADNLIGTNETPRGALVWRAGRTERVPAGFTLLAPSEWGPTVRSPVLSPLHKVRLLTEPLRRRGISEDESIGDFVRRRLGRGVLNRLAQPLAAGIYAGDVDRLSLRACLPQFAADEAARGRVTGKKRAAADGDGRDGGARYSLFVTHRDGVGEIAEAAANLLPSTAFDRRFVRRVRPAGDGWTVSAAVAADGPGDAASRYAAVILACPARVAADVLRPAAGTLADELAGIEHASSVVVNSLHREVDVRHPLDAFGLVIPEAERAAAATRGGGGGGGGGGAAFAVSFASRKFPGRAPAGWVQLRTFLGGFRRGHMADRPDDELIELARGELARLLGVTWTDAATATARVGRWRAAMPQYHVGHIARVARIEHLVADRPGLELAGNGLHGVGLPAAVRSGTAAAERAWNSLCGKASGGRQPSVGATPNARRADAHRSP